MVHSRQTDGLRRLAVVIPLLSAAVIGLLLGSSARGAVERPPLLVNSYDDAVDAAPGDGVCAAAIGQCTLRAAVMEANALSGYDVIYLPDGMFALTLAQFAEEDAAAQGDLDITDSVLISGTLAFGPSGIKQTVIDAQRMRAFEVVAAGAPNVTLQGLVITNGGSMSYPEDGAIENAGTLTLRNVHVRDSQSNNPGPVTNSGVLTVIESVISGNASAVQCGGLNNTGAATLERSIVRNNSAGRAGGGLCTLGEMTIRSSTISTNRAGNDYGGGVLAGGQLRLINSTVSGNVAGTYGGAISASGAVTIEHTTIASNTSGIGIWPSGRIHLTASVLADNRGRDIEAQGGCGGLASSGGYNFVGAVGYCDPLTPATTDRLGVDPRLAPLNEFGGYWLGIAQETIRTHALEAGSPARDVVPLDTCTLTGDQRGVARPAGTGCDAGSVETREASPVRAVKWVADAPANGDSLGAAVDVDGNTAVVGAPNSYGLQGKLLVYVNAGGVWTQQAVLTASDGRGGDLFGSAVAISGDTIVASAPQTYAVYVFQRAGGVWLQQARLTSPTAFFGGGVDLALSGDTLAVGAPQTNGLTGAIVIYTRQGGGWTASSVLTASDGRADDWFGASVTLDGEYLVAGAPYYGHTAEPWTGQGAAYVFRSMPAGWSEQARLQAADAGAGDRFGASASVDGERILIGAPFDDEVAEDAGAAYAWMWDGTGWQYAGKLALPDARAFDNFGSAVGIAGSRAAIGAPNAHNRGYNHGAVALFDELSGRWAVSIVFAQDDAIRAPSFGAAVALDGAELIIGARVDSTYADLAGSAYAFTLVDRAPTIATTALPEGRALERYAHAIVADGFPLPTYSLDAAPSGMAIDERTGLLGWTPASDGNYIVVVRAANGVGADAARAFTLVVRPAGGQYSRDVGAVRVWADQFAASGDEVIAQGRVALGPVSGDVRLYGISTDARWMSSGPITLHGELSFAESGAAIGSGVFRVNTTSGVLMWDVPPAFQAVRIGNSQLMVTPTLSLNILQPVARVTEFTFALPENPSVGATAQFDVGPLGMIDGTAAPGDVQFSLAGAMLAARVTPAPGGLIAATASLKLAGAAPATIANLTIDGVGDMRLRFGSGGPFAIGNIELGESVAGARFTLEGLTGTVGLTANAPRAYVIDWTGSLRITGLPGNPSIAVSGLGGRIAAGMLEGAIPDMTVDVSGSPMVLRGLSWQRSTAASSTFDYALLASSADWAVPPAWRKAGAPAAKIQLTGIELMTRVPYLRAGGSGGSFTIDQTFYLAGDPDALASIAFNVKGGSFTYRAADNRWVVELSTRVSFKLGLDRSASTDVVLTIDQGGVSGSWGNADVSMQLAGLTLTVNGASYRDGEFTAQTSTLSMPESWRLWGASDVAVGNVRISPAGVSLGSATFTFPEVALGDVLRLTNMTATLGSDAQRGYYISVTGNAQLSKVDAAAGIPPSADVALTIERGRVTGSVTGFSFKLVGIEFVVNGAHFVDNVIAADTVDLKLAKPLSGQQTTLHHLEIGGASGISVRGGRFNLPDFRIGTIGVQNVVAEFKRLPDGNYSIAANAKLGFTQFSAEGGFTLFYKIATSELELKQVSLAFEGTIPTTAIPIGATGFYLTRVWGTFDLTSGSLEVRFGATAKTALNVGTTAVIEVTGDVLVRTQPFSFTTQAQAKLVGIQLAKVSLTLTPTSFNLDAEAQIAIIKATLKLAFGKDRDGEFTMYGMARAEVFADKGALGCKRILWWDVCLPPSRISLGGMTLDAGKFRRDNAKLWGARSSASLFGVSFYVFVQFAPRQGIDIGTNLSAYQPILPASRVAVASRAGPMVTYDQLEVDIDRAATRLLLAEGITTTNLGMPAQIVAYTPAGVQIAPVLQHEEADRTSGLRLYSIAIPTPADAVGRWRFLVRPGNLVQAWAEDPVPLIDRFDVCTAGGTCLQPATGAPPQVTIGQGEVFTIDWGARDDSAGLEVEVFAIDEAGNRHIIVARNSGAQARMAESRTWTPVLASGVYTLALQADDGRSMATLVQKEPIRIADVTPPAPPRALVAQVRPDGSVLLAWDGAAAEADIAGYWFSVDGAQLVQREGQSATYELYGLQAGSSHEFGVAAYDLSGNRGAEAVVRATMPAVGVTALWPPRGASLSHAPEVRAVFAGPIDQAELIVRGQGGTAIDGAVHPLTATAGGAGEVVIGVVFTPRSGTLAVGDYQATIRAKDVASGGTVEVAWTFRVGPMLSMTHTYLPLVRSAPDWRQFVPIMCQ